MTRRRPLPEAPPRIRRALRTGLRFAAALAVVVAGCSRRDAPAGAQPASSAAPPAVEKVTLALNWVPEPEFGGIYAAREGGAFARHGLDVEISGGGDAVVQMIATGRTFAGIVSADEIVIARSQGIDVVGVFATYQTSPQGIMVRASRKVASLEELFARGGTVAMQPGLAYKDFLEKRYGFSKVTVVPYDGGLARFAAQEDFAQQCFVTSEPIAAKGKGIEPRVFLVADSGYNPYTAVVAVSGDSWRRRPATVKRLVAALAEGWRAYLDDPAPTNAVMAKLNPGMDLATMGAGAVTQAPLIETAATREAGLGSMSLERWSVLARQLGDLGVVKTPPDPASCFVAAADLK